MSFSFWGTGAGGGSRSCRYAAACGNAAVVPLPFPSCHAERTVPALHDGTCPPHLQSGCGTTAQADCNKVRKVNFYIIQKNIYLHFTTLRIIHFLHTEYINIVYMILIFYDKLKKNNVKFRWYS